MWIHVPATYSASAQDTAASSLDSTQPWMEELARSVTWKTNSVSPASLRRVWKTVPSIQRLSGLTCEPLTQNRGVAEWISSLGASRASHIASQEASSEKMTQENSQERSSELLPDLDTQLSFLKMSPASSDTTGIPYDPNYERWVTRLRKDSSQRQRRAHLTSGNGSSSWPTATVEDAGRTGSQEGWEKWTNEKQTSQYRLRNAIHAKEWPTPTLGGKESRESRARRGSGGEDLASTATSWPTPAANEDRAENYTLETSQRHLDEGRQVHLAQVAKLMWPTPRAAVDHMGLPRQNDRGDLQAAVQEGITNWPTPTALDRPRSPETMAKSAAFRKQNANQNTVPLYLGEVAQNWPTPDAGNFRKSSESPTGKALNPMAKNWPTPQNKDYKRENLPAWEARQRRKTEEGINLQQNLCIATLKNWLTPTTRDHKDGTSAETVPENALLGRAAPNWANSLSIPQDPATMRDGHTCSPSCRRLNPLFVEMIMGLCPGWTDDSVPLAMGSFQQWQHSLLQSLAAL